MNNKKILAVIRTSTIRQEIQSQKTDLINFCIQKGFKEENIIFVEGFGASARKRNDKYIKMLEDIQTTIEKNNIKYVAVWHLNRLGRTEENLSYLKEYFERNKIQVYIKNPSLTLFNEDGTLNNGTSMAWTIFAMMIKFDTIELMEKLSRGRKYKKEQKKFNGGTILYGYQSNESGYFEENKEESDIVKYIFNFYSSGKVSAKILEQDLIEKGYSARNNKPLTNQFISKIIRTEDYYNGKLYPPIITEELYNRCRSISLSNNFNQPKERKVYLGTKKLKCLNCGHSYFALASKGYEYYRCVGYHIGICNSEVKTISRLVFDYCIKQTSLNIYSQVLYQKDKEDIVQYEKDIMEKLLRIETLNDIISKTEKKIKRINDLYINGSYLSEMDYQNDYNQQISLRNNSISRKTDLENDIKTLKKQISVIKQGTENGISKYMDIRKNLLRITDIKQLKEMVDISIEKAYLKKVFVNGSSYIAIIIESALENHYKSLYLSNRNYLLHVALLEDNSIVITQMDYKNNSIPILRKDIHLSIEEYQHIIS